MSSRGDPHVDLARRRDQLADLGVAREARCHPHDIRRSTGRNRRVLRTAPVAHARVHELTWTLVACAVLVQIAYPLTPLTEQTEVTVLSVVVFSAAMVVDVVRLDGPRYALRLLAVACGG